MMRGWGRSCQTPRVIVLLQIGDGVHRQPELKAGQVAMNASISSHRGEPSLCRAQFTAEHEWTRVRRTAELDVYAEVGWGID